MATTISGSYFAINTNSFEASEGVFNIELSDRIKSGVNLVIEVTETFGGEATINLPSCAELKGYPDSLIMIRDANGSLGDGTQVTIAPYTIAEPVEYNDSIQNLDVESVVISEINQGIQLSWGASVPSDGAPDKQYWNAFIFKL